MQGCHWMGRAAWNIQINRNQAVQVADNILAAPKRATGDRAATAGDNDLGRWNRFVGRKNSRLHVVGNRAGNVDSIRVTRRGDKINAKALQVKKRSAENIGIRFAGVAPGSRDLSELQRAAKKTLEMLLGVFSQGWQGAAGEQGFSAGGTHLKVIAEGDEFTL